ncbi:MAG TPA: phosphoenolpyruvate--protein phosphotransferase [Steroidobacteraceae bacterium]|nr:phosphoenolpyruvate--protein phosphotransferase [Steroidobacteraceae bacterium]
MATLILRSPLDGWSTPLEEVPDPAFAERMLGDGLAIDPTSATLCAPCDGEVISVAVARHALTVRSAAGVEILLHVGLDTVKSGGRGFRLLTREGARVGAGEELLAFELDSLVREARSLLTPVIVMERAGVAIVRRHVNAGLRVGDVLMEVETGRATDAPPGAPASAGISRRLVVGFEHGIHARPAALLARSVKGFSADIALHLRGRSANAQSSVALMGLGVQRGEEVTLHAAGPDAAAAIAAFEAALAGAHEAAAATRTAPPRAATAPATGIAGQDVDARVIRAVVASRGIAAGRAARLAAAEPAVAESGAGLAREAGELARARTAVKSRVERLYAASDGAMREVLEAHVAFIEDVGLVASADSWIARGKSAGYAWRRAVDEAIAQLRSIDDARVRERIDDLNDLAAQVLRELSGAMAVRSLPAGAIVLADELLPSQFAAIAGEGIAGLCLAGGGPTSHVAILAAAMGMPMLVAAGTRILEVPDGADLVLDAERGVLIADPVPAELSAAHAAQATRGAPRPADPAGATGDCCTADGLRIAVFANIGSLEQARQAAEQGAEGCGLLRTEFLFLDRDAPPDEALQAAQYQRIADALAGRPLVIRTLDAGGDKAIRYLQMPREDNPALGLRGVRISLSKPELLRVQLRAVAAVTPPGSCRVMLPMVTDVDEIRAVRRMLDDACRERGRDASLPLGVMIETPAAALIADRLAEQADFLSIGTNDLTQYTLAMDRGNPALAARLDGLHPAVLRLIAAATEAARRHDRHVSVCGGLASDPAAVPVLIGLGVQGLSVVPSAIRGLKALIGRLSSDACRALAKRAVEQESATAVRSLAAAVIG